MNKISSKNKKGLTSSKAQGFTLIELMTSIAIFSIVMTISMGAILGVFQANRKSNSLKTVMDNLNLSIESMSREIRFGSRYHCGSGDVKTPKNCSAGGESKISFLSNEGIQIVYRLNGTRIEKSINGGSTYVPVTSPEITIENLTFFVIGAGPVPTNTIPPKVLIKIKGMAGTKDDSRSNFTLQTLVAQRKVDR